MKRTVSGLVLAAMLSFNALPFGLFAKLAAPIAPATPPAKTEAAVVAKPVQASVQAAPAPAQPPAQQEATAVSAALAAKASDKLRAQAQSRTSVAAALKAASTMGQARPGEPVDTNQVSVSGPWQRGDLNLAPNTKAGLAYVAQYQEPNAFEYRNFCGAGAAVELLSHWDANLPKSVDIDKIGQAMGLDPNDGAWIYKIAKPVNDGVNKAVGKDVNYYRYGQAQTVDDFRYMLDVDINQNGVPLITGVMTGGLPGWGGSDVGHIIAVYGYNKMADGREFVTYADTGSAASGYHGTVFNTVDLGTFWSAVNQNSAQIW
jgi:hypothetical protein